MKADSAFQDELAFVRYRVVQTLPDVTGWQNRSPGVQRKGEAGEVPGFPQPRQKLILKKVVEPDGDQTEQPEEEFIR